MRGTPLVSFNYFIVIFYCFIIYYTIFILTLTTRYSEGLPQHREAPHLSGFSLPMP